MRIRLISKLHHKPAGETTGMTQAVVNLLNFLWGEHVAVMLLYFPWLNDISHRQGM